MRTTFSQAQYEAKLADEDTSYYIEAEWLQLGAEDAYSLTLRFSPEQREAIEALLQTTDEVAARVQIDSDRLTFDFGDRTNLVDVFTSVRCLAPLVEDTRFWFYVQEYAEIYDYTISGGQLTFSQIIGGVEDGRRFCEGYILNLAEQPQATKALRAFAVWCHLTQHGPVSPVDTSVFARLRLLCPDSVPLMVYHARCLIHADDRSGALTVLLEAARKEVSATPKAAGLGLRVALELAEKKMVDIGLTSQIREFCELLGRDPSPEDSLLAAFALRTGDRHMVMRHARAGILAPRPQASHLKKFGQLDQLVETMMTWSNALPTKQAAPALIAWGKLLGDKTGGNRKLFEHAIKISPKCVDAYFELASIPAKGKKGRAKAMKLYQRVLELAPEHRQTLKILGQEAQKLGRVDDAIEYLGRFVHVSTKSKTFGYGFTTYVWQLIEAYLDKTALYVKKGNLAALRKQAEEMHASHRA